MTPEPVAISPALALATPNSIKARQLKRLSLWLGAGCAVFALGLTMAMAAHRPGLPLLRPGQEGPAPAIHGG